MGKIILPGDILNITKGTEWSTVSLMVRTFTWRYWIKGQKPPRSYHSEIGLRMIDDHRYLALSAQPPIVTKVVRDLNKVGVDIWRLKDRDKYDWKSILSRFCSEEEGKPYDFPTFMMFGADWIFHTILFSKMMKGGLFRQCAELTATLYQKYAIPCSDYPPQSTSPDIITDYCSSHPEFVSG